MRHLLLVLLAAFAAAQESLVVANYATQAQRGWVFVATPEAAKHATGWLKTDDGQISPYVRETGGVRVWTSMPAGGMAKLLWIDKPRESPGFAWHPVVEVNAMRLLPYWTLGDERSQPAALRVTYAECLGDGQTVAEAGNRAARWELTSLAQEVRGLI